MSNKVYRVKQEHVLEINDTNQSTLEMAYINGYVFVKCKNNFYILNTNKKRTSLQMQLIEVEIKAN